MELQFVFNVVPIEACYISLYSNALQLHGLLGLGFLVLSQSNGLSGTQEFQARMCVWAKTTET